MPALTTEARRRCAEQIAPELLAGLRRGIPEELLPQLFQVWFQGVCTQLANFPADLRIEAWIAEQFPGLRRVQRRSLLEEVARALPSFLPEVVAFTPPSVYRPTMAMNAAQAWQVAELYGMPELMGPFDRHGFGEAGRHLARLVLAAEDRGHASDMAAVNRWAELLGLEGWFDWRPYEGSR